MFSLSLNCLVDVDIDNYEYDIRIFQSRLSMYGVLFLSGTIIFIILFETVLYMAKVVFKHKYELF